MKRGDFKSITEEHFEICEDIIKNNGACYNICDNGSCPFSSKNATNEEGCGKNKYVNPNIGAYYSDDTLLKSAKEFLKFREEKNMRGIFMYNGKIYKVIHENAGSMLSAPVSLYDYILESIRVCEQEESGFFIRKDLKGLYYCEPYTQEYNTTEKILCCNDGYRIESVLAVLNNLCPDFKEFVKIVSEL